MPRYPTNVSGTLFFRANDGLGGEELWASDGRSHTYRVKDVRPGPVGSSIYHMTNVNGMLYFTANDGTTGRGIWKSDGTEEGTSLVRHLSEAVWSTWTLTTSPLENVGGALYFIDNDGASGMELWKIDGVEAGAVRVKDTNLGATGSNPKNLIEFQGILFFSCR